jgi:general secretion pathway protein J
MRSDRGISLVETLAALAIVGMTCVMLVSGVSASRRAWERIDQKRGGVETVVSAQNLIRLKLEHAFPQTRYDASAPYADFAGETNGVNFLAPASAADGRQALRRYALKVSPAGDLVLESASDVAAENRPPGNDVLLKGINSVSLAYFSPDAAQGWQPRWQSRDTLPALVRIHVDFASGDTRFWPDLIVRPAATVDTLCVLNTASGRCRGRA